MKFTCTKSELQSAVSIAAKAASAKSPIPALEGILIETGIDAVKLTGYDLKKGIYTSVEANITEPGSIVLGARIFGDIDDPNSAISRLINRSDTFRLLEELGTDPQIYYIPALGGKR